MSKIRHIWHKQSLLGSSEVIYKEKIEEVANLCCYIGTIGISGAKVFILELDKEIKIHQNYLKRFVGVEIQVLPALNHSELVIILLENDLSDIFSYFIEDIVNELSKIDNQNEALLKISTKINYWKRLFSKVTGELLNSQQQSGLYGELYFLNELLEHKIDHSLVIDGWHGPFGANQDFWYNGIAVEVKTSKSNKPSIKISNEYQLDISGLNELYLIFYKINMYQGGTDTLFKIIAEIRKKLDYETLASFNEKVQSLGIYPELEEEYNSLSFSIIFEKQYKINEDFPKIIRKTLNDSISSVTYEIDPKHCTDFEIDIDIILTQIANGNL